MAIARLHHVALVCADAQRTVEYYTRVLGLRLVKQTVTGEAPHRRQLYFGDEHGAPGSLIVFVEDRDAPRGHEGLGGTHHYALLVESGDVLRKWKRRLVDHGVAVNGPLDRHYFESIYHRDPDGNLVEIATRGAGWSRDEAPNQIGTEHRPPPPEMLKGNRDQARIQADTWPEPVPDVTPDMRLQLLHHVTAIGADIERVHAFLHGVLGLRRVKRTANFDMPDSFHWYWGVGDGAPGTVVTYFERPAAQPAVIGPGQAHHYALMVPDDAALGEIGERLRSAGHAASPVEDRRYYKCITTRDPDGQVVEIATAGPGFTIDEPLEALGQRLQLPPALEARRAELERTLGPLALPLEETV